MRLQIEVDDATGMITDAKFKTFGCGSAIASSSLATEWLKGKSVDEALKNRQYGYRGRIKSSSGKNFTVRFWQKMLLKQPSTITVQKMVWKPLNLKKA